MERTESVVVQVAPAYENPKIAEMESFGWNLQGRQQIEEAGEAYVQPSFLDSKTYVVKQRVSRYVKLHFVRPLSLPNLSQIKEIESDYFSLPFPSPPSQTLPVLVIVGSILWTACSAVGTLWGVVSLAATENLLTSGGVMAAVLLGSGLVLGIAVAVGGIYWYRSNRKRREAVMDICEQSATRARELIAEAESLLQ